MNPEHDKYEEKFKVEAYPRKLSSWTNHAKKQILRFMNDDEFNNYCANVVMSQAENPPGPFTRFLYWFGMSCEAGWGVMVDFNEYKQKIFLCDKYYKWMHKLRDELNELKENELIP